MFCILIINREITLIFSEIISIKITKNKKFAKNKFRNIKLFKNINKIIIQKNKI